MKNAENKRKHVSDARLRRAWADNGAEFERVTFAVDDFLDTPTGRSRAAFVRLYRAFEELQANLQNTGRTGRAK